MAAVGVLTALSHSSTSALVLCEERGAGSGLLVLSRSWRFVRIGHALFTITQQKKAVQVLLSTKHNQPLITLEQLTELEKKYNSRYNSRYSSSYFY